MSSLLNPLNAIIDYFIPEHMRGDIAKEKRVRMFMISHLIGPFLGHPVTVFLLLNDPNPFPHVHILGLSVTAFWLFPALLRLFPTAFNALAFLSIQNLAFVVLWGSYHYGGGQSPFLMWYLILPVLAFFYLGSGLKTSVGIFLQSSLSLAVFAYFYLFGGPIPQHIPTADMAYASILSAFFASTYIFFMAGYYATVVDSQSEFLKEIERHQQTLAQLTDAKDEAERANGAKSEFLAKMSHELRTPLNAVLGYSEILLEDAELDGRGSDIADLQKISAAGKHLLSMVNDILDISKIEAGKTDLYLEDIDLDNLIDEIDATSRPLAAKNTNKFVVERDEKLGMIHVDGTKLRQAIYNLLSNAAKFTQSGQITLKVRRKLLDEGDRIFISVSDTGVGISEEGMKNLFSSFSQANASITAKFGGTGLGLSLSRNLCRLMGGDITVASNEGKGSTFTIEMPAHVELDENSAVENVAPVDAAVSVTPNTGASANRRLHESEEDDAVLDQAIGDLKAFTTANAGISASDERRGSKGKIIIVDDDRAFLELTERLLTKEGYSAICTESPEAVLQLARTVNPKMMIVDVLMPGLDGWDVLQTLKSDPTTASIPVVMTSVLEDRQKAEAADAMAFIEKPLDTKKLQSVLARMEDAGLPAHVKEKRAAS